MVGGFRAFSAQADNVLAKAELAERQAAKTAMQVKEQVHAKQTEIKEQKETFDVAKEKSMVQQKLAKKEKDDCVRAAARLQKEQSEANAARMESGKVSGTVTDPEQLATVTKQLRSLQHAERTYGTYCGQSCPAIGAILRTKAELLHKQGNLVAASAHCAKAGLMTDAFHSGRSSKAIVAAILQEEEDAVAALAEAGGKEDRLQPVESVGAIERSMMQRPRSGGSGTPRVTPLASSPRVFCD
eukprot:COSAG05_NODE_2082_length_3598_cov_9.622464_2_plen_242_part_00